MAAETLGVVVALVTVKLGKQALAGGVVLVAVIAEEAIVEFAPAVENQACGVAGNPACATPLASSPLIPPVTVIAGAPPAVV